MEIKKYLMLAGFLVTVVLTAGGIIVWASEAAPPPSSTRSAASPIGMAACPYGMRNLVQIEEPKDYHNPDLPTPPKNKVDKCTFCAHLVDNGQPPACVAACPAEARIFGDLKDPHSEVRELLANRNSQVLRPDFGTKPQVVYLLKG